MDSVASLVHNNKLSDTHTPYSPEKLTSHSGIFVREMAYKWALCACVALFYCQK